MFFLSLLFALLLSLSLSAQTQTLYLELHEKQHVLTWTCEENVCKVYLNDSLLVDEDWHYGPSHSYLSNLQTLTLGQPLILMRAHNGDGCPWVYHLLSFDEEDQPVLSDYFGNCNEIYSVKVNYPKIHFEFQGSNIPKRKRQILIYDLQTKILKQ